jgi:uncharacterized membrane protein
MRSLGRVFLSAVILLPAISLFAARASGQAASGAQLHVQGIHRTRGANSAAAAAAPAPAPAPAANPPNMAYNGGPVIPTSTTYAIWWGKPSDFPSDAVQGVDDFLMDLDGSDYLGIADQYMLGNKAHTRFGGNLFDYSAPAPFDAQGSANPLANELLNVLQAYGMSPDLTAVYVVYTSNYPSIMEQLGFCAFHGYVTQNPGTPPLAEVAYVPNTAAAQETCGLDLNGEDPFFSPDAYSRGTRSMVNETAHEFMETITDPLITAWYAPLPDGNEIGDSCAYIFQTNVPIEDDKWRIQGIWSNQAGGCAPGSDREARVSGASFNSGLFTPFDTPAAIYGIFGTSMNAEGLIAGYYIDASNNTHAFLRDSHGAVTTIDPPGTGSSNFLLVGALANSINSKGAVAGYFFDTNFVGHGFLRDKQGAFTTIDAPNAAQGTSAHSVNDEGEVAGSYEDSNFIRHGYVRDKSGRIATFDPPDASAAFVGEGTRVFSINNSGSATGYSIDANAVHHGFVRNEDGAIATFSAPGAATAAQGEGTFAWSINNDGEIAGYFTDSAFKAHGFVRDKHGLITTFDAPGAVFGTFAYSINDDGAVAGYYSDASGFPHGFVRDKHGNFTKVDAPGKSYGTVLRAINNKGDVAGYHTAPTP